MCGIVGVFNFKNESKCTIDKSTKGFLMNFFLTELLIRTESRGKDATGFFTIFEDGNSLGLKHAKPASDFISTDYGKGLSYYEHVRAMEKYHNEVSEIQSIIGHCRNSTVGSKENINNHPIVLDNELACVHNGTLSNLEKIIKQHRKDFTPISEVDSEMIAQLAKLWQKQNGHDFTLDTCKYILERLEGPCATLVTSTKTDKVAWLRYDRPLFATYLQTLGLLLVASERDILKNSLELYKRLPLYQDNIPKAEYLIVSASLDHSGVIDLSIDPDKLGTPTTASFIDTVLGSQKVNRTILPGYSAPKCYYYRSTASSTHNTAIKSKSTTKENKTSNKSQTSTTQTSTNSTTKVHNNTNTSTNEDLVKVYIWSSDHYEETVVSKSYFGSPAESDDIKKLFKNIPLLQESKTNLEAAEKLKKELDEKKLTFLNATMLELVKIVELNTLRRVAPMVKDFHKLEQSNVKARKRILSLKKFIVGTLGSVVSMTIDGFKDTKLSPEDAEFVQRILPEAVLQNSPKVLTEYINRVSIRKQSNEG